MKMNKYEKLMALKDDALFQLLTGVTRELFLKMLAVLTVSYNQIHETKGGNPSGTPIGLKLVIALEYWREYRTMRHMAFDYSMPLSTLCNCITWVEDVLSKSSEFKIMELKEKFKHRETEGTPIKVVLIDVEEQPIERPRYNQKNHYSGKKNVIRRNTK